MKWSIYERQPEEDLFSRLPEGWVFTTPSVWLVGDRSSYSVNDKQKAEVLARLGRWRAISFVLLAALVAALAILLEVLSRLGMPDWINFAIFAISLTLSTFLLFGVAIPSIQLFILRPILAGAVPTTSVPPPIPIGFWDSLLVDLRRQARTYSSRWLMVSCLLFGSLSIKSGYDAFTSKGDYLYFLAMVFFAVISGVALFLKLRERRSNE